MDAPRAILGSGWLVAAVALLLLARQQGVVEHGGGPQPAYASAANTAAAANAADAVLALRVCPTGAATPSVAPSDTATPSAAASVTASPSAAATGTASSSAAATVSSTPSVAASPSAAASSAVPPGAQAWAAELAAGYWDGDTWLPVSAAAPAAPPVELHVYAIGDSIDRNCAIDLCAAVGTPANGTRWADDLMPYVWPWHLRHEAGGDVRPASLYCTLQGGSGGRGSLPPGVAPGSSWATLHHFGAAPTGPYLEGYTPEAGDWFVDTQHRLPRSLELYQHLYRRRPTLIVYRAGWWVATPLRKRFSTNGTALVGGLEAYARDLAANVALLRAAAGPGVAVALSTTPTDDVLLAAANSVMRSVAASTRAPLLDWAAIVDGWARRGDHRAAYRDDHHPVEYVNTIFTTRVLELAAAAAARGDAGVSRMPLPPLPSVDVGATPSPGPSLSPVPSLKPQQAL